MIAGVGRLTGKPGLFWHFHLEKASKLLPVFDIRTKSWRVREKKGKCLPNIRCKANFVGQKTPRCVCSLRFEKSLKANLFVNLWVSDFADYSFVGVLFGFVLWLLMLLFSFSIYMRKQTREWFGGSSRRSHTIIHDKSIAVPSTEEPHICRNEDTVWFG